MAILSLRAIASISSIRFARSSSPNRPSRSSAACCSSQRQKSPSYVHLRSSATAAARATGPSPRLSFRRTLHDRADLPRREFVVAEAQALGLAALTGCDLQHQIEDARAHLLDRALAVQNAAAVEVHVLRHATVHLGVGRELD